MTGQQPGTTMYRIAELEREIAELKLAIRDLDRLRPTCRICMDAPATRQTTNGPACTECVGDLPGPEGAS